LARLPFVCVEFVTQNREQCALPKIIFSYSLLPHYSIVSHQQFLSVFKIAIALYNTSFYMYNKLSDERYRHHHHHPEHFNVF